MPFKPKNDSKVRVPMTERTVDCRNHEQPRPSIWLRATALSIRRLLPFVVATFVALLAVSGAGCDLCANEVISEYPAPDGKAKVVVFGRSCGATTGFSTQASIVQAWVKDVSGSGNAFVGDTDHGLAPASAAGGPELRVRWLATDSVEFAHHAKVRVFKAERQVGRTSVHYVTFDAKDR